MDNNNWLQQLVMLGIGTTTIVTDKLREAGEQLVNDGKGDDSQAKKIVEDLMQQLQIDPARFDAQMQRWMRQTMQDLGVPRQSEMDELRGRIDRLERQVRELENQLWKKSR
jgi:polyhydroxyalkanoate synthesis regulator phasin